MKIWRPLCGVAPFWLAFVVLDLQLPAVFAQGTLTPPGAPAPTMRTLEQIEPRTPISSLPFNITNAGSYYLTTNLTGVAGQNGITITTSSVTLDLNGFDLEGVPGASAGISAPGEITNVFIHNGTVRNWGNNGVSMFSGHVIRLEHIHARQNTGSGLASADGLVLDCTAISNTTFGIAAGSVIRNCVAVGNTAGGISSTVVQSSAADQNGGFGIDAAQSVVDCAANYNRSYGIHVENGGVVSRSVAQLNSGNGIMAGLGSLVRDCTVFNNGSNGIVATVSCRIVSCVVNGNETGIATGQASTVKDCTVRNNLHDGIQVPNDCVVMGNDCVLNGEAGIHATIAGNRIEGNTTILNGRGVWVQGSANLIIRNSSRYNPGSGSIGSSNFVFSAGNTVGEILNFSSGGTLTNANPWANISY